jgi:hypothetical protein
MTEAQRLDSGFAEVSGAPLYYEFAGAGHPLVLILLALQMTPAACESTDRAGQPVTKPRTS